MNARSQRWRERQSMFRPGIEPIDTRRYGVEELDEGAAEGFVVRHHYSSSFPAARVRVGLYRARAWIRPELVGVAVFSVPMQQLVIPKYAPGLEAAAGVELGRFVLLDDVEGNGETWFLARAFRLLRARLPELRMVLSFSDPLQRLNEQGRVVMPGHVGAIYQAFSGRYVGRSKPRWMHLAPDGRAVSPRTVSKIRNEERGAGYAYRQLLGMGAPARRADEDPRDYVARALAAPCFRRVRHPGNHAYVWPLDRGVDLAPSQPYPRTADDPTGSALAAD